MYTFDVPSQTSRFEQQWSKKILNSHADQNVHHTSSHLHSRNLTSEVGSVASKQISVHSMMIGKAATVNPNTTTTIENTSTDAATHNIVTGS